jgi:hypothetical protein
MQRIVKEGVPAFHLPCRFRVAPETTHSSKHEAGVLSFLQALLPANDRTEFDVKLETLKYFVMNLNISNIPPRVTIYVFTNQKYQQKNNPYGMMAAPPRNHLGIK